MPNIKNKNILWHLLAIAIVAVWGTTFVNTKVLYNSGLTPLEIFSYALLLPIFVYGLSRHVSFFLVHGVMN